MTDDPERLQTPTSLRAVSRREGPRELMALRCLDATGSPAVSRFLAPGLWAETVDDPRASLVWDPSGARVARAPLSVHERGRLVVTLGPGVSLVTHPGRLAAIADRVSILHLEGIVGASEIAVEHEGRRVVTPLEVRARWAEDLLAVDAMIDEIAAVCWSAAMAGEGNVWRWASPCGAEGDDPWAEIVALRALVAVPELDAAVRAVARLPASRLARAWCTVRAASARDLGLDEFAARGIDPRAGASAGVLVREHRAGHSLDVPENRLLRDLVRGIELRLDEVSRRDPAAAAAMSEVAETVARWRAECPWLDLLAEPDPAPQPWRRAEYQCIARAVEALGLGPRVDPGGSLRVASRDTPTLYERWCALEVAAALGVPTAARAALLEGAAVALPWTDGPATLQAQRRFTTAMPLAFRPDLTLEHRGRRLLLDAKYRLEGHGADSRMVRTELVKMHAYRDAIPGSVGAYALFPGPPGAHLEGRDLRGAVGALSLAPRSSRDVVDAQRATLREIAYALLG